MLNLRAGATRFLTSHCASRSSAVVVDGVAVRYPHVHSFAHTTRKDATDLVLYMGNIFIG